jgi:hypothetical protein
MAKHPPTNHILQKEVLFTLWLACDQAIHDPISILIPTSCMDLKAGLFEVFLDWQTLPKTTFASAFETFLDSVYQEPKVPKYGFHTFYILKLWTWLACPRRPNCFTRSTHRGFCFRSHDPSKILVTPGTSVEVVPVLEFSDNIRDPQT